MDWISEYRIEDTHQLVKFRRVQTSDADLIAESIRTASPETLLHRFFSPILGLPPSRLIEMLTIDQTREECIIGECESCGALRIICGARYVRRESPEEAEIAVTVHDEYQAFGLGRFLLLLLRDLAIAAGVTCFHAEVLESNQAALSLIASVFPHHQRQSQSGLVSLRMEL